MIQIEEVKIAELMFDIWHNSNDLKNPVVVGEYIANKLKEAISVTRCCTELKDKETMTFEEWKKENVVEENVCNEYLYKYGGWFDADELLSMYKKDISL